MVASVNVGSGRTLRTAPTCEVAVLSPVNASEVGIVCGPSRDGAVVFLLFGGGEIVVHRLRASGIEQLFLCEESNFESTTIAAAPHRNR